MKTHLRIKILDNNRWFPSFDYDKIGDTVKVFEIEGATKKVIEAKILALEKIIVKEKDGKFLPIMKL
ncbi:MAG: hypothetical protein BWZ00_01565 [Bacteroidetes bacterium ADurb.BinA174]|nr:MAG: hypothetical protein BWZ00_01565 [Bacteroidetes bacterium ADurb.BinA174]